MGKSDDSVISEKTCNIHGNTGYYTEKIVKVCENLYENSNGKCEIITFSSYFTIETSMSTWEKIP